MTFPRPPTQVIDALAYAPIDSVATVQPAGKRRAPVFVSFHRVMSNRKHKHSSACSANVFRKLTMELQGTRDLRINRLPLDLPANPHECSLSGVRASNISCSSHLRKARGGVI